MDLWEIKKRIYWICGNENILRLGVVSVWIELLMLIKYKNINSFLFLVISMMVDKYIDRLLSWRGNEVCIDYFFVVIIYIW